MSIRIIIVEDEEKILYSLEMLLAGTNRIEVIGTYSSGGDAINEIPNIVPDVALVDLKLPDISGIEVIKEIKETSPATESLVFTQFEDDKHLFSALKAGAIGYLLKDASPREIIEALEEVHSGGAPMSRRVARRVLEEFHSKHRIKGQNKVIITAREKEILEELAKGFSVKELAMKFCITHNSVRTHLKHIYKKLHVHSMVEAITKARRKRIIPFWL